METSLDLPPSSQEVRLPRLLVPRRALRVLGALLFASACCLVMIPIRRVYAHYWDHLFLIWNLMLAWVPLPFSVLAYRMHAGRAPRRLLFLTCAATWFFFFPNAPYLMTDFVHLRQEPQIMLLLDIIGFSAFAWVGLCLGFCSLYLMQEVVGNRFGRAVSWLFVLSMITAASFGTYVGRILRWNSWDVLHHPFYILAEMFQSLLQARVLTGIYLGMMFLFLLLSYCTLFALTHLHEGSES